MDFRNLLQAMSSLSEGETKETPKGRVHKGDYGSSHGKEDVRDQYGHKVGKINKDAEAKKEAPKKGRGRPKKGADDSGEVKKYDTTSVGDVFGGGKKPKKEVGKVSKKHSLKEYIDELQTTIVNEGEKDTSWMNKQTQDFYNKNPNMKRNDREVKHVGDRLATKVTPTNKSAQVTKKPMTNFKEQGVAEAVRVAYRDPTGKTGMPGLQGNTVRYKSASQVAGNKAANPDSDWVHNSQTQAHRNAAAAAVKDARAKGITPGSNQGIGIHKGVDEDMNTQQPVQIKPASQTNTQVIQQGNKTLGTVSNPQLAAQIKQSIGKGEMTLNPDEQNKMNESSKVNDVVLTEGQKEQMTKFFDELELGPKGYNIKPAIELKDKALAISVINKTLAHGRFRSMAGSYKDQMRDSALEHFGFVNFDESLEEGDLIPHPSKDLHTTHGMDSKPGDISMFKPSRIQATNKPVEKPTPWSVDPINAATDRAVNFISGLRKPKTRLESTEEMKDVQYESWENQLNKILNEGITVSSSTGQQGAPDSVTISATDADAEQLMGVLRNAGIGVFGGNDKPAVGYGVVSQGEEEPTGTGTQPQMSPDVVGDDNDMLALIKKMSGIDMGGEEGSMDHSHSGDYEDEEGSDDTALQPAGDEEGDEQQDDAEDSGEDSGEEEKTDEGNAFSGAVAKAKSDNIPDKGQKFSVGGKQYPVKEDDMEEGNKFTGNLAKARAQGKKEADLDGDGDMEKVKEGREAMQEDGMPGAGNKEALAKQIYDLGMSIHTNDRIYNQDDPEGKAQLAKLKAQFAQQFPGEDPHKLGSAISHNEYQTQQQQKVAQAKQRPAGIMQKAKNALGGMFEDGEETCNECGGMMYEGHTCEEQVEEGFSNDAGGDAMGDTELMQLKALLSMGGDLHKMKSDQTVGNPTRVSVRESLNEWKKLSGIK